MLFSRWVRSCSSAMALSVGRAAKAFCTGPYQVRKTSTKCAAERYRKLNQRRVTAIAAACWPKSECRCASTPQSDGGCTPAASGRLGRHVEYVLIPAQLARFGQQLADELQGGADHRVVSAGPRHLLAAFESGKIDGCVHADSSLWCRNPGMVLLRTGRFSLPLIIFVQRS